MSYEQFVCAILECAKRKISEYELIEKQEILKNNGVISVGLTIRRKNSRIAPIVYMEEFYEKYMIGNSIESLSDILIERSRKASSLPACSYEEILDFEKIKEQIVYKLVNAEKNDKLLREVPNLPVLNFAIVFYWMIPADKSECGSVMIRNEHMNLWKLPISVLYQCAKENTPKLLPYIFSPLNEYVKELAGAFSGKSPLYVLTNQMGMNGASTILYPGIPGIIYENLRSSYYLLPSSIHEFLIVPESEQIRPENLRRIVREVNETQIQQEEFLSDHIYYFDGNIITKM